jgi:hypothetical protein
MASQLLAAAGSAPIHTPDGRQHFGVTRPMRPRLAAAPSRLPPRPAAFYAGRGAGDVARALPRRLQFVVLREPIAVERVELAHQAP